MPQTEVRITSIDKHGFGFADSDDGQTVFLDGRLITEHKLKVGDRFIATCNSRPPTGKKYPKVTEVESVKKAGPTQSSSAGDAVPAPKRSKKRRPDTSAQKSAVSTRYQGEVKFFNTERGFGFIQPHTSVPGIKAGKDVFVHLTSIQASKDASAFNGSLEEGDVIEFAVKENPRDKKLEAAELRLIRPAQVQVAPDNVVPMEGRRKTG